MFILCIYFKYYIQYIIDIVNNKYRLYVWGMHLSCVQSPVTSWTVTHCALLSIDFPGNNTGRLPLPFSRDLPDPGIEPISLALPALAGILYQLSHQGNWFINCNKRVPN